MRRLSEKPVEQEIHSLSTEGDLHVTLGQAGVLGVPFCVRRSLLCRLAPPRTSCPCCHPCLPCPSPLPTLSETVGMCMSELDAQPALDTAWPGSSLVESLLEVRTTRAVHSWLAFALDPLPTLSAQSRLDRHLWALQAQPDCLPPLTCASSGSVSSWRHLPPTGSVTPSSHPPLACSHALTPGCHRVWPRDHWWPRTCQAPTLCHTWEERVPHCVPAIWP